jgi:peroxiredoxin Q/BCP
MAKTLEAGQAAPDFRRPAVDGRERTLADFRGRWLVLFFYPKASTTGCTIEARAFEERRTAFDGEGASILGASRDGAKANAAFAAKQGLAYPLLCDEDRSLHEAYGVLEAKKLYGKPVIGTNRSTFLIDPEGRIAKIWRDVRPAGHAGEVLGALTALRSAGP